MNCFMIKSRKISTLDARAGLLSRLINPAALPHGLLTALQDSWSFMSQALHETSAVLSFRPCC